MKRFFAILLALAMIFAISTVALAESECCWPKSWKIIHVVDEWPPD